MKVEEESSESSPQTGSQSNIVVSPSAENGPQSICQSERTASSEPAKGGVEYIFSSMRRRGNRNKALLLRERRDQLRERRSNGYKRCGRVSSKQVAQEWVQDKSRAMVVIGSDVVSLFPSLTEHFQGDKSGSSSLGVDQEAI